MMIFLRIFGIQNCHPWIRNGIKHWNNMMKLIKIKWSKDPSDLFIGNGRDRERPCLSFAYHEVKWYFWVIILYFGFTNLLDNYLALQSYQFWWEIWLTFFWWSIFFLLLMTLMISWPILLYFGFFLFTNVFWFVL